MNMVLNSLIKKELAEEIPAEPGAPVWREDEDGNALTLRATSAAYGALGIVADTGADTGSEEEPATDMADQPETSPESPDTATEGQPVRKMRQGTKQEALIVMLKRPEGASIAEIMEATDWLAHTIRGAIAGALKKKLGLTITSEKVEGRGRTYKIAD
ncbi:conserved hypothetical protein [Magnetospirillum sp. SS-4]|nr:conserved hypothetical protein [Magnetospirillum sp. SS-4]